MTTDPAAEDAPDPGPPHDPRAVAAHYRAARVHERLLLTGHSHQAWPDVAREAQLQAFDDATALVDEKWDRAFAKARQVQDGWLRWLGDDGTGVVTLADSTHTLLVRLLSALDLRSRPRVVTTDGEFHSARRQLARLAETGVEVVAVPAAPAARWPSGSRPRSTLRPVVTGWFAEFADLAAAPAGQVGYGDGPERFAGSTYDPTSHYRAARVLEFFDEQKFTPASLRRTSRHQVGRLAAAVQALDLDPSLLAVAVPDPDDRAGFLALRTPHAGALQAALRDLAVLTDHRGDVLRLGPAPYLRDDQLDEAVALLGQALRARKPPSAHAECPRAREAGSSRNGLSGRGAPGRGP